MNDLLGEEIRTLTPLLTSGVLGSNADTGEKETSELRHPTARDKRTVASTSRTPSMSDNTATIPPRYAPLVTPETLHERFLHGVIA